MRRRWAMLLSLSLSGCMGFDEYYAHDGLYYESPAPPPCGCAGAPRSAPAAVAFGSPPPGAANVAPVPQSREPELLR